jgi:hypothetical protein
MGGWKARVLQAHSTELGIVIRKTRLYDFSTWAQAKGSFDLCLRLMASVPIGDTRRYAPEPRREPGPGPGPMTIDVQATSRPSHAESVPETKAIGTPPEPSNSERQTEAPNEP